MGYITYDVNGADVSAPNKQAIFADGSTVIEKELSESTLGTFTGWATSVDGEVVYQKGDTLTETSDVTLYAVWKVNSNPPVCEFTSSCYDVVAGDTFNMEFVCTSESGFIDSDYDPSQELNIEEITTTDEKLWLEIFSGDKTSITNGYKYGFNISIENYSQPESSWLFSVSQGVVLNEAGGNEAFYVQVNVQSCDGEYCY